MGNTILLLGKSMVEKVNARQEKITFKLFGGYFFNLVNWGRRKFQKFKMRDGYSDTWFNCKIKIIS